MTAEELTAIEKHAQNVDSRLAEGCLRVIYSFKGCQAARASEQRHLQMVWRQRNDLLKQIKAVKESTYMPPDWWEPRQWWEGESDERNTPASSTGE